MATSGGESLYDNRFALPRKSEIGEKQRPQGDDWTRF
jgi:hypothetical protein